MTPGVYLLFLEFGFAPILFPVAFIPMPCPLQAHSEILPRSPTAALCLPLRAPPAALLPAVVQPLLLVNAVVVRARVSKRKARARTRVPFLIKARVPHAGDLCRAEVGAGAVVLPKAILRSMVRVAT